MAFIVKGTILGKEQYVNIIDFDCDLNIIDVGVTENKIDAQEIYDSEYLKEIANKLKQKYNANNITLIDINKISKKKNINEIINRLNNKKETSISQIEEVDENEFDDFYFTTKFKNIKVPYYNPSDDDDMDEVDFTTNDGDIDDMDEFDFTINDDDIDEVDENWDDWWKRDRI